MQARVTEKDGVYTASIPLPLMNGQELVIQGRASVGEVMEDLGYSRVELGFWPIDEIGKVFKGIAKSKAVRKAVGIAKDVLKSPITTAALGVVTGGAAVAPLAAANGAIRIAEAAAGGGRRGKRARKVMRASMKRAEKMKRRKKAARRRIKKRQQAKAARRRRVASSALARVRGQRPNAAASADFRAKMKKLAEAIRRKRAAGTPGTPGQQAAEYLVKVHFK